MSDSHRSLIAGFISIITIIGIYYLLMTMNVDNIAIYIGTGVVSMMILGIIRRKMNENTKEDFKNNESTKK